MHLRIIFLLIVTLVQSSQNTLAQTWRVLFDKADSLYRTSSLDSSYKAHQQATAQAIIEYGEDHLNYAQSVIAEGKIQWQKGDYDVAIITMGQANELLSRIAPFGQDRIEALDYMGSIYLDQGKIDVAEIIIRKALIITDSLTGTEKLKYRAFTLSRLGDLYTVSRQWAKAEPILLEALRINESLSGKLNRQYANTLHALSNIYLGLQQYDKAQEVLVEVISLNKQVFGTGSTKLGTSLGNMGSLYLQLGDYTKAISYFRQSLEISEKNKNTSTINYAISLQNLGICYNHEKNFSAADSSQRKALYLLEKKTGKKTVEYANALSNRASIYLSINKPEEACLLYEEVLKITKEGIGTENTFYARYLNSAANAYKDASNYAYADSLNTEALAITNRVLGSKSISYATYLSMESELKYNQKISDIAIQKMQQSIHILEDNFIFNFHYLAPRQKETFTNQWSSLYSKFFSMLSANPFLSSVSSRMYETTLFLKSMLLNEHAQLLSALEQTSDKLTINRLDSLRKTKDQLATQYTKPLAQRQKIDSLETRAETLEKDLARQSAPFRQAQQSLRLGWEDIRNALKPHEAAVEFISFAYNNGRQQTDSVRYLALILRPGDTSPQMVPLLTDEAPLRQLLARKTTPVFPGKLATRGSEIDTDQLTRGDSLYRLIWQPIDRLLTGVKTVYLAPSGLLHQVAFAALLYHDSRHKATRYLADRYQLRQVGSTRQVVTQSSQVSTYQDLISARLYGGIEYDTTRAPLVASTTNSPMAGPTQPGTAMQRSDSWPYLPGTQREVEQIGQFIGPKAVVIMGSTATETALKALSGQSPTVVHIATHGFTFPDPAVTANDSSQETGGNMFRRIANPLLRTGLLMAGANRVWQGGRPALGQDDGILTAYEIANLNLSATKMVVLSACETALGDIRGSEGVFGLQRAFKMAGVDYLLMSLWPVADEATSELMTQFYRNWKKYKTIRAAFEQTQRQVQQKYPPAIWAAFVLIE